MRIPVSVGSSSKRVPGTSPHVDLRYGFPRLRLRRAHRHRERALFQMAARHHAFDLRARGLARDHGDRQVLYFLQPRAACREPHRRRASAAHPSGRRARLIVVRRKPPREFARVEEPGLGGLRPRHGRRHGRHRAPRVWHLRRVSPVGNGDTTGMVLRARSGSRAHGCGRRRGPAQARALAELRCERLFRAKRCSTTEPPSSCFLRRWRRRKARPV